MNKEILPVLDEISAVLKKHDMAGLIMVANSAHCDYRLEIDPSWSCASFINFPDGSAALRVRSKLEEYPSKEAQKKSLEATVGTFVTFDHTMDRLKEHVATILRMISQSVDFLGKSTMEDG